MGARSAMTMRALIEEDTAGGPDPYGHPLASSWSTKLTDVACRVYSKTRREVIDGDKTALVEDIRAIFPLTTNVIELNRLLNVKDRLGATLFAGPLSIDTLTRRRDHLEAALRRVQS